ncbi:DUF2946 family protein [Telluria beijingensis]|uniref:DUF2946 family protein n=1 Tax=Telluria beijingensis TaxID=3068633 RepID=UPI0027952B90|nr:DUF2946 family protein [Massilia sp. REN29]
MTTQRNRSIISWLAVLALLWGMLAPSLASNLTPYPGKTRTEVCTSAGARLVALDAGDAGQDQAIHFGMHCQACVSQYDLAVVAHPPGSLVLRDAPLERILRLDGRSLPPAAAIRTAHRSRAPPSPA